MSQAPEHHPVSVFKKVGEKVASGKSRLYPCHEQTIEEFLSLKLAMPNLSDEAAALLLIHSKLDSLQTPVL